MAARNSGQAAGTNRATEGGTRATARSTAQTATRSPRSGHTVRSARGAGGNRGVPAQTRSRTSSHSRSERTRELSALVLFGVAVFLLFALIAPEKGGVVGRGVETGLVFAFGRLAFVFPVALIAGAAATVLEWRYWRSYRFLGAMVLLFGLFLLLGGAVPPFGSHGEDFFVRGEFETRAGVLGEAFYAGVHGLTGVVGVGIVGWLTALVGFSLLTGITGLWVGRRTRQAARIIRTTADRSTLLTRRRDEEEEYPTAGAFDFADRRAAWPEVTTGPVTTVSGPQFGPIDLVERDGTSDLDGPRGTYGDAFDDWTAGRPISRSPLAPLAIGAGAHGGAVLNGAEAFADIYDQGPPASDTPVGQKRAVARPAIATATPPAVVQDTDPSGVSAQQTAVTTEPATEQSDETTVDPRQGVLPGLARPPRQIELAVTEPAYLLPEPDMLRKSTPAAAGRSSGDRDIAAILLQALATFGVEARIIGMVVGPRVTRYELQLAPGTKVAKVSSLKDDLAYALATTEIRILTPIPGKSAVGVEIPNQRPDWVTLGDIYHEFPKSAGPLMVWLGKDIAGNAVYADLTKLPHLLIAGTTGSGKSGCVNCIVSSVLLRSTPEQVRMIMIDPKKVELSHYDRIPHLLVPVVTNMKDAAGVLHNVVKEMEDRYELMELDRARSLAEMNKVRARRGERPVPYILLVIDELADLMMASPQEVEDYVIRLAQKSRAVGIHLVVATQRPSADVITGMIKANIPSRIAFAVSSQTDSRVILDVNGAETLLGMGDMLFKPLGSSLLQRVQGAYITEEEIAGLVNHWRLQAEPEFREELLRRPPDPKKGGGAEDDSLDPDSDDLLAEAAELVIETGSASVSMLQRRLRVGYTRAGRLIDMLERRGIVGPWEGSKPRQILIERDEAEHVIAALRVDEYDGGAGEDVD